MNKYPTEEDLTTSYEEDDIQYTDTVLVNTNHITDVVTESLPQTYSTIHRKRTASGVKTPQFRIRKERGDLLPYTPWTQSEFDARSEGAHNVEYHGYSASTGALVSHWSVVREGGLHENVSESVLYAQIPNTILTQLAFEDRSGPVYIQAAAAKLVSTGFDALTFAAEAVKLREQFALLVDRLVVLIRKFTLRRLASAWLEYRYAWRTLWFDMLDFDNALRGAFKAAGEIATEKAGSTSEFGLVQTTHTGNYFCTFDIVTQWRATVGVRGSIAARIAMQQKRIRANAAITAWELIKFSFIIDWFFSVGNFLETLDLNNITSEQTSAWGYYKTLRMNRTYANVINRGHPDGAPNTDISIHNFSHAVEAEWKWTHRSPHIVPNLPLPTVNLNPWKILDLLSLALRFS